MTDSWLRCQLVPRHSYKSESFQHDPKNHAMASLPAGRQACTVTAFWLKYMDPTRMLRRVTPTKLYRRAVMRHVGLATNIQTKEL